MSVVTVSMPGSLTPSRLRNVFYTTSCQGVLSVLVVINTGSKEWKDIPLQHSLHGILQATAHYIKVYPRTISRYVVSTFLSLLDYLLLTLQVNSMSAKTSPRDGMHQGE